MIGRAHRFRHGGVAVGVVWLAQLLVTVGKEADLAVAVGVLGARLLDLSRLNQGSMAVLIRSCCLEMH